MYSETVINKILFTLLIQYTSRETKTSHVRRPLKKDNWQYDEFKALNIVIRTEFSN
jgi:hypothetical protein